MAPTTYRRRKTPKPTRKPSISSEHSNRSHGKSTQDSDSQPDALQGQRVSREDDDEATWDGLRRFNGIPVQVYLFKTPVDLRKLLISQIEGLGGAEAMIKEEAEMLLVPAGKLTAKLEEAAKEDGQMVRDTEWLAQLWRDQHGDDEIEINPPTSKKKKAAQKDRPSTKVWDEMDDENLVEYMAQKCPGDHDAGRQGRRIYRELLDSELDIHRWARGYSVEQMRMRYKHYRKEFDRAIRRTVRRNPMLLVGHLRYASASKSDWELVSALNANARSTSPQSPRTPRSPSSWRMRRRQEDRNDSPDPFIAHSLVPRREGLAIEARRFEHHNHDMAPPRTPEEPLIRDNQAASGSGSNHNHPVTTHDPSPHRQRSPSFTLPTNQISSAGPQLQTPVPERNEEPLFLPSPHVPQSSLPLPQPLDIREPSERVLTTNVNAQATARDIELSSLDLRAPSPVPSVDFPDARQVGFPSEPTVSGAYVSESANPFEPTVHVTPLPGQRGTHSAKRVSYRPAEDGKTRFIASAVGSTEDIDFEFEQKRKKLRAVGAVNAKSPPPKLPPSRSTVGRQSIHAPRKSALSNVFSPASVGPNSPAYVGTPRVSLPGVGSPRIGSGGFSPSTVTMTVAPENEKYLQRKAREFGFKYAEVVEQYFNAGGDLERTVLWMKNRYEAMMILLEDEDGGGQNVVEEPLERSGRHNEHRFDRRIGGPDFSIDANPHKLHRDVEGEEDD